MYDRYSFAAYILFFFICEVLGYIYACLYLSKYIRITGDMYGGCSCNLDMQGRKFFFHGLQQNLSIVSSRFWKQTYVTCFGSYMPNIEPHKVREYGLSVGPMDPKALQFVTDLFWYKICPDSKSYLHPTSLSYTINGGFYLNNTLHRKTRLIIYVNKHLYCL